MFYLIGIVALFVFLIILLVLRPDLRRQVLLPALCFVPLGPIAERAFFKDYWSFQPILPKFVLFGADVYIEDLLFAFVSVGIMAAIFDVIFRKRTVQGAYKPRLLVAVILSVLQILVILFLPGWIGLNSIFAAGLGAVLCALVIVLIRRDLWKAALGTSLICGVGALVFYFLILLLPGAVEFLFTAYKLPSEQAVWLLFGVPVPMTEILWAACTGAFFGVLYKLASGAGYAKAAAGSLRGHTKKTKPYPTIHDLHKDLDKNFVQEARSNYGAFMATSSRYVFSLYLVRRTAFVLSNLFKRKVSTAWGVVVWALLPLAVNLILAPFGLGCAGKDLIWLAYGGIMIVLLLVFPRLAWTRLIKLSDQVDDLLLTNDQRKEFIHVWSYNNFSFRLQAVLTAVGGVIGMVVMVVVAPLLQAAVGFTAAFYLAIFIVGGLGVNAGFWLWMVPFNFRWLFRFKQLKVVWNNPAKTPSIREASRLFGFIAILGAIGLIWLTIPIIYVDVAAFSDTWIAYAVKAIEFTISVGSVAFIAVLPQYWLSSLVAKEKNKILSRMSDEIHALYERKDIEESQKWPLLESKNNVYQAINATSNSVIDLSTVLKYTLAVISTALPFVLQWIS